MQPLQVESYDCICLLHLEEHCTSSKLKDKIEQIRIS
jgi:hypothetical protein